jgi:hypothetical protein
MRKNLHAEAHRRALKAAALRCDHARSSFGASNGIFVIVSKSRRQGHKSSLNQHDRYNFGVLEA